MAYRIRDLLIEVLPGKPGAGVRNGPGPDQGDDQEIIVPPDCGICTKCTNCSGCQSHQQCTEGCSKCTGTGTHGCPKPQAVHDQHIEALRASLAQAILAKATATSESSPGMPLVA
jgi:hypothetical protein